MMQTPFPEGFSEQSNRQRGASGFRGNDNIAPRKSLRELQEGK